MSERKKKHESSLSQTKTKHSTWPKLKLTSPTLNLGCLDFENWLILLLENEILFIQVWLFKKKMDSE